MKLKPIFALNLVLIILSGCVCLPGHEPDYASIIEEKISIAKLPNDYLTGIEVQQPGPRQLSEIIQFDISSSTDLLDFFKNRVVQVRCRLDDDMDRQWSNFGYGPFYEGTNLSRLAITRKMLELSPTPGDGKYHYTVYAFKDLTANWLENNSRSREAPLESLKFSQISCYIIGVSMAPVTFPRSTEFTLSREKFMMLIKSRSAQPAD